MTDERLILTLGLTTLIGIASQERGKILYIGSVNLYFVSKGGHIGYV